MTTDDRTERIGTEKWGHELEAARSRLVSTEAEIRDQACNYVIMYLWPL